MQCSAGFAESVAMNPPWMSYFDGFDGHFDTMEHESAGLLD